MPTKYFPIIMLSVLSCVAMAVKPDEALGDEDRPRATRLVPNLHFTSVCPQGRLEDLDAFAFAIQTGDNQGVDAFLFQQDQDFVRLCLGPIIYRPIPNGRDTFTPLHLAARYGNAYAVRRILWFAESNPQLGAYILTRRIERNTALHLAARYGHVDAIGAIVEFMIRNPSFQPHLLTPQENGLTALDIALLAGQGAAVNALLATPFRTTLLGDVRRFPLETAVMEMDVSAITELLSTGHTDFSRILLSAWLDAEPDLDVRELLAFAAQLRQIRPPDSAFRNRPSFLTIIDEILDAIETRLLRTVIIPIPIVPSQRNRIAIPSLLNPESGFGF